MGYMPVQNFPFQNSVFRKFADVIQAQEVTALVAYMNTQWMHNASVPISEWNVHALEDIRTNNAMEGYHSMLKTKLGVHPGNNH